MPSWKKPRSQTLAERGERLEVGVVAAGLAGQRDVQGVVEVVAPLGVEAEPADLAGQHHQGVVEVGLRDQRERAAQVGGERGHLDAELLEQVDVGLVGERVHGVEPESVDVEVAQPGQRAVEDVAAHLGRPLAVEVDQRSPGVLTLGLEVGTEQRQVVARRAEMVVDDVLDDTQSGGVGGVDEALVRRRAAVLLVDCRPQHAVVAPVVGAVEGVDRQQLDQVDAECDEVVELLDRPRPGCPRA